MAISANTGLHQPLADDDCRRSVVAFDEWREREAARVWADGLAIARTVAEQVWDESNALRSPTAGVLARRPDLLPGYRAATVMVMPREVLATRSGVGKGIVSSIERTGDARSAQARAALPSLAKTVDRFLDPVIAPWLAEGRDPTGEEKSAWITIVGDRMARASADSILRNLQERRQELAFCGCLEALGYRRVSKLSDMSPGAYMMRPPIHAGTSDSRIPIDVLVHPLDGSPQVFVELKSAGDVTNTNKRRKEESARAKKIRETFGVNTRYVLVLGGHFDTVFVNHMKGDDIEWIWEHDVETGTAAIFGPSS